MVRQLGLTFLAMVMLATLTAQVSAQGPKADSPKKPAAAKAEPAEKPKATTHTVKREPLKIEVKLDGLFEAALTEEIVLRPEVWSTFKVLTAAQHGQKVKRGDLLIAFDPKAFDQAIVDARSAQQIGTLSLKQAELAMQAAEQSYALTGALADRARRIANEDLHEYLTTGKPLDLKATEFSFKRSKLSLEYAEEELRQLEKMYKADDLTEETEEIVLARARNNVESARFSHERAKYQHAMAMKYQLPRQEEAMRTATQQSDLTWHQEKAGMPLTLQKQRLELEKLRLNHARSEKKLKQLLADREWMTVKAPCNGVVYFGQCVDGKWSGAATVGKKLRPNGSILPNEVVMTVVQPRPLFVRVAVPEKELAQVAPGGKGTIVPVAFPEMTLTAIVEKVLPVPTESGQFPTRVSVALDAGADAVMPGMNCKLTLVPYANESAITVPLKALQSDPKNPKRQFVEITKKDGSTYKVNVTVGRKTAEKAEILKGLKPGQKVRLLDK